jgi:hypothetical protein
MNFPYDSLVATGVVDREAWADVVRELLAEHTKGKKATFARLVGFDPTTIGNWLRGDVAVSEASVRQVAERCGRNPMDLLIRVGFYRADQLPVRLTEKQIDEEQQIVLDDPTIDDEQKAYILRELDAMRTSDERLLEDMRARDRERRRARITELIERAQRTS